jgi:hypothetical protein
VVDQSFANSSLGQRAQLLFQHTAPLRRSPMLNLRQLVGRLARLKLELNVAQHQEPRHCALVDRLTIELAATEREIAQVSTL